MLKESFASFCGWFVLLMVGGHFAIILYVGNVYSIPFWGDYISFNLIELTTLSIYWTISSILIAASFASIKWAILFGKNKKATKAPTCKKEV